jgi:hypothetical protein
MGSNQKNLKNQNFNYLKTILFFELPTKLAFFKNVLKSIFNMWLFNIIDINSKNMFILIIEMNNIFKFNVSKSP